MVAQLTLDQLVKVRILVPQWFDVFALCFHKGLTRSVQVVGIKHLGERGEVRLRRIKIMWFVYLIEYSDGRFWEVPGVFVLISQIQR
jgi:hypothetical protein